MTRAEIIAEAREWAFPRTAWVHQASLKNVGADCVGFVAGVAANCGSAEARTFLESPAWRTYGREPNPEVLLARCRELMDEIDPGVAGAGDVVVIRAGKWLHHVGFISSTEPPRLLHASRPHQRVVEHRIDDAWRARIMHAFRFRDLT